uniref:Uncharacterized protein n=1 Tax=Rhizophora mucronata TaxID=61149 RepID=A0A2P2PC77_RHIMU
MYACVKFNFKFVLEKFVVKVSPIYNGEKVSMK